MTYVRSTNSGKTIIHKVRERPCLMLGEVTRFRRERNVSSRRTPRSSIRKVIWILRNSRAGSQVSWRGSWAFERTTPLHKTLSRRTNTFDDDVALEGYIIRQGDIGWS